MEHAAVTLADGTVLLIGGQTTTDSGVPMPISTAERFDPVTGAFQATGSMSAHRARFTATRLADGRVLVIGGMGTRADAGLDPLPSPEEGDEPQPEIADLATAEVFDPSAGQFHSTGSMPGSRAGHAAALLSDGRVLVVGREQALDGPATASALLYDPRTGSFSATGSMTAARIGGVAVTLADGRVLVAGGVSDVHAPWTAELYDPVRGTFSTTGPLASLAAATSGSLLADGRAVLCGHAVCQVYDPSTGTFTAHDATASGPDGAAATVLPDGRVVVSGGVDPPSGLRTTAIAVEDAASGTVLARGTLAMPRTGHSSLLLTDGRVLIVGGTDAEQDAEIVDLSLGFAEAGAPASQRPTATPSPGATPRPSATPTPARLGAMTVPRTGHTATLLDDGRVLIVGGSTYTGEDAGGDAYGSQYGSQDWPVYASAELFDPVTSEFSLTGWLAVPRTGHTATLQADGRVLIAGGAGDDTSTEFYDPATGTFSPGEAQAVAGIALPGGRELLLDATGTPPDENGDTRVLAVWSSLYDPTTGVAV
ncbi:MAG TPA: kelch repeat-containing protein, partial [Acidimicrobiales bacterium]|nr:kelch repeat-containing protein [Acidimicrobiales bacterium]